VSNKSGEEYEDAQGAAGGGQDQPAWRKIAELAHVPLRKTERLEKMVKARFTLRAAKSI